MYHCNFNVNQSPFRFYTNMPCCYVTLTLVFKPEEWNRSIKKIFFPNIQNNVMWYCFLCQVTGTCALIIYMPVTPFYQFAFFFIFYFYLVCLSLFQNDNLAVQRKAKGTSWQSARFPHQFPERVFDCGVATDMRCVLIKKT